MSGFITIQLVILMIAVIGTILLSSAIYRKNSNSATNKLFFYLAIIMPFWLASNYISIQPIAFATSLIWIRLSVFFAAPISTLFFLFVHTLPSRKIKISNKIISALIMITVLQMLINISPYAFVGVTFQDGSPIPVPGVGLIPFALITPTLLFITVILLVIKFFKAQGLEKQQLKLVVVGVLMMWGLVIFTIFIPAVFFKINFFVSFLPMYVLIFLATTAYAIAKHHFLDVRLVMRQSLVYGLSVASIIIVAVLLRAIWRQFFLTSNAFFETVILILGISLFPFLKSFYYRFANKYLFSSLYDSSDVISGLSDKLRSTLEVKSIYRYISGTLTNAFHAKNIAILIFDEKTNRYQVRYNNGFDFEGRKVITVDQDIHNFFVAHDEPETLDELEKIIPLKERIVIKELEGLTVEVINPLNIKDKPVGLILMGRKESGDMYNEEDFKVLNVLGTQAAIALENALLYEETKKFTVVLEKKVQEATSKLREQNEDLKKLDEMKTEFVSIASHQLRTPLTATKWALEYLGDSLEGKLNAEQAESLDELEAVNRKLINLVNELLNISRIEEGRVRVDPKPTDLVKMVKTNVKEFMPLVRQKKLKVFETYDPLPPINLDENIVSKAIANFLSNAIKYNRNGKRLTITIKKVKKDAVLTLQDEGIGIPVSEQKNIFQKFFRAANAVGSNTEGTGLGMYIAKTAIELSGGKVWFESTEGTGTTFTISLPLGGSKQVAGEKGLA